MRSFYWLSVSVLCLAISSTPALAGDPGAVRLNLVEGDVQVLIHGSTDWTAAAVNLPLDEGDRLWVPETGRAELQVRGGVSVRADANTSLDILGISGESAQFYVDRGHVYINNLRGGIKTVQFDTPLSSIRGYDNSAMMIDTTEDGPTEVSVLKGDVYAESRSGATRVRAGSALMIRSADQSELAPLSAPDDWERWNLERDKLLTAWSESSRYLPDDLHDYSSDFDRNGRWNYVTTYGYVWVPGVTVAGWAPYTVGRWVWIRGNYVWVSSEPWGWAPGHYGRWIFQPSFGWCWVPPMAGAVYWGPGYVGWIVTPTYVAWVPLAPGELYYGYGHYGPGSVNITTVNVNTTILNRTYINSRVNNAVVTVQRDTFGTGKRHPIKIEGNPFLEKHRDQDLGRISIVPPPIRPQQPIVIVHPEEKEQNRQRPDIRPRTATEERETRREQPSTPPSADSGRRRIMQQEQPSQRTIERVQPPERVRKTRPEEVKAERKVVQERGASVFRQHPPENLPVRTLTEPRKIMKRQAVQQRNGEVRETH